ncbi:DUF1835 domain-containing protein [Lysinibacillus sp. LZ02]|uniref:DUF1835 domain-containing protein n=1 Tax=Lysinibacillus sp. LZ02 TaxID=3420668 RepID=UPI003D35AEE1
MEKGLSVIKTRANYPFMYFSIETNVVMVYQIESEDYLTKEDLLTSGMWKVYEIENDTIFEKFNHEEHKVVEGNGLCIGQNELSIMLEEINTHIQKNRYMLRASSKLPEQQGVMHIVMSESAAGALRVGLTRPKTVIGFPDSFSIGPLWKFDEQVGQNFRNEWLYDNINYEQEDDDYQHKFANTLRQMEDIPHHTPIYIWYGDNANEQVGLRFILYLLRQKTNEIFLINSTALYEKYCKPGEERPVFQTSQMDSNILGLLFEDHKRDNPLCKEKRIQLHTEWEKLTQTKEVLRFWIDGEIHGVPEHHIDSFIIEVIEKLHSKQERKEFIQTSIVIVELMEQMKGNIDLFCFEYRIRHLIYRGLLELKGIPKSMRHYSIRLR